MVEAIQDLGLCSRGSGADNIRNVTGTPTAGIDPQELIDTRPYAREWHFHILNDRSLYGIPRKFNVGFDGGGVIAGAGRHQRHRLPGRRGERRLRRRAGHLVPAACSAASPGIRTFARDTGVIVKPDDATKVADAVVRVFIDNGDRTNRAKARLKYVLDAWGFEKFLAAMEEKLGHKLTRAPAEAIAPRPAFDRLAHIGAHPQKQNGPSLDRRRAAGRQAHRRADARPRRDRRRIRRRRYPPHGLAEPVDLGRSPKSSVAAARSRHRSARAFDQGDVDPRRPRRLHRQCRLPARAVRYQASRRGDRALVRSAGAARRPAQHPSHRLPQFLRPALHRRHRPPRHQGAGVRGRRSGRGLSHSSSAAVSVRTPRAAARSITTSKPRTRRRRSSACSRPISRHRASAEKAFWPSRAVTKSMRSRRCSSRRRSNERRPRRRRSRRLIPDTAPFIGRAAHLAQRLLRRPALARRRRQRAVAEETTALLNDVMGDGRGDRARSARRRRRRPGAVARPRHCRSPNACSLPKAGRCGGG